MFEYKSEVLKTGVKWFSDKANDADVSALDSFHYTLWGLPKSLPGRYMAWQNQKNGKSELVSSQRRFCDTGIFG